MTPATKLGTSILWKSKPKIVVIVGPTASGKSALAIRLARQFNGEVVSADSRQVYRELNIGSGKIAKREMRGVRHHLLDVASPKKTFTVARYKKLAEKAVTDIARRGKLPIVCGGAGFYIDAVFGKVIIPSVPPDVKLRRQLDNLDDRQLYLKLKQLDPARAKNIDRRNRRRLVRAIEVARAFPKGSTFFCQGRTLIKQDYPRQTLQILKIGLMVDKEKLRQNIQARLRQRLKHGLIAEVKRLHAGGLSWQRLDNFGLDYRYAARYLQNKISREQMISQLETAIWHYAKRQMTWFKRDKNINWVETSRKAEWLVRHFLKVRPFSVKVEP